MSRAECTRGLRGKFPAIREFNREFYENRAVWRKIVRKNAANSVSCRTIPYKMKQGINSRRTGNLSSRAGNLLRLAGNCPPGAGTPSDFSRLPRPWKLGRLFAGQLGESPIAAKFARSRITTHGRCLFPQRELRHAR